MAVSSATPSVQPSGFTAIPNWVLAAGLSPQALALVVYLAQHVNTGRGDRCVWPSRARLAALMGYRKAASVDRYLAELAAAGIITTRTRHRADGGQTSNAYLLFALPAQQPPRTDEPRRNMTADIPVTRHVQPPLMNPCPQQRTGPVPDSGHRERQQRNYTAGTRPRAAEPASADAAADEIIDAVNAASPAAPISARHRVELRGLIRAALDAGRPAGMLRQHLTTNLAGVRSTTATIRWRLTDGMPPVPARPAPKPSWCGTCDERTRLVGYHDADAVPYRCPVCHPLVVAAA